MPFSEAQIAAQLRALGVSEGATVLLRANLGAVGRTEFKMRDSFVALLLGLVGPSGTIMTLTFTPAFAVAGIRPENFFDANTPSTSGPLAKLFLDHPGMVRSAHPVNSFAAIGSKASFLCGSHGPDDPPYLPIGKLVEAGGRMLIIGCTTESPGFTTVHWTQWVLGLASLTTRPNRQGVYCRTGAETKLHRISAPGGCSRGFWKLYSHYAQGEALATGNVGGAYSLAVDAAIAHALERDVLTRDPRTALCDDPDCAKCRAGWRYNRVDQARFYLRRGWKGMRRILLPR